MTSNNNKGVNITGGSVQIGQMAVGDGARAEQSVTLDRSGEQIGWPAFARQSQILAAAVEANLATLRDASEASRAAHALLAEVQQPSPSATTARSLLQRLVSASGPVGAVLEGAAALKELLSGFGG